jgi:hypothetical protein
MARVVVVLHRQCDDQLKDGSPPHTIGYRLMVSPEYKCRRVGPPPTNLGVRGFGKLTISMAECEGLALVILAKIEK